MNIGIIGLGLIGGSFAKGFKALSGNRVFGYDICHETLSYALLSEAIDEPLNDELLTECDLIVLALYPQKTIEFLTEKAPILSKSTLVMDTCGTKREVCKAGFALADQYGFTFVGAHPMAGTQFSGIKYSKADLFDGASMIIVPPENADMRLLESIKSILAPLRFGKLSVTSAEEHDKIIAFTSQLAHVVSSAYIKSDTAQKHHGFSAGSYRDMTRVATLNDTMWTELFLENRDNLLHELDNILMSLNEYRTALAENDPQKLSELLQDGTKHKADVDGFSK